VSVTTITQNCVHRSSAAGRKFLATPTTASAQCLRLSGRFFHLFCNLTVIVHVSAVDAGRRRRKCARVEPVVEDHDDDYARPAARPFSPATGHRSAAPATAFSEPPLRRRKSHPDHVHGLHPGASGGTSVYSNDLFL